MAAMILSRSVLVNPIPQNEGQKDMNGSKTTICSIVSLCGYYICKNNVLEYSSIYYLDFSAEGFDEQIV